MPASAAGRMGAGQMGEARMSEPDHHRRYAEAWQAHRTPGNSEERLRELEKEMDSAQNHFGWNEFQEFKKSLPDFFRQSDKFVWITDEEE